MLFHPVPDETTFIFWGEAATVVAAAFFFFAFITHIHTPLINLLPRRRQSFFCFRQ
jgi:hypothetical protein